MQLDERGKACPLPVIETKRELEKIKEGEEVEVLVDNEIAVQNLQKMSVQKGHSCTFEQIRPECYLVRIKKGTASGKDAGEETEKEPLCRECSPDNRVQKGLVVALTSDTMGRGDDLLGHVLMKGFVYALTEQENVPETVLLYNGGAKLATAGSESLEDLKLLKEQGCEILTCGTCLKHYGLNDKLAVGSVTNMYQIAEILTGAQKVVKP
ncbi:MAG: sulfurtransferase-like selenium metabolism protein YedF [Clostridiales bacterium]|nr:sulfurtransferase-like selenium metabolism protein YedF [Clostridiales bacterium]